MKKLKGKKVDIYFERNYGWYDEKCTILGINTDLRWIRLEHLDGAII